VKTIILVEIKNVYGALKAYPANEAADLLAQIAGTDCRHQNPRKPNPRPCRAHGHGHSAKANQPT
jgi:hypothetical protein